MNNNIHPVLYHYYLRLQDTLGAEMVHRRKRTSTTCIDVIFYCDQMQIFTGRVNTLPEAEACGWWVICRPQTQPGRTIYNHHKVFQLFLSPVHPKKRRETKHVITPLQLHLDANTAELG